MTNKVELQKIELHYINDQEVRIEVALSLNNRTEEVERISQNNDEAILINITLATLDVIRLLIPRPLECQIDYIKKVEAKPSPKVQSLLRLKESGKENFLSGSAVINNSLYQSAVISILDALARTLEKMIELQQKRERIGRSGSFALETSTMAIATELLEERSKHNEIKTAAKTQPLDPNFIEQLSKTNESSELTKNPSLETSNSPDSDNDNNDFDSRIINSSRANELYEQGENLVKKGNYQQAIFLLKEAINLDKNNANCYCLLGVALSNTNIYEGTEEIFLKAIELNSKVASYHTELGLFYKEIGRVDKSQKALEKAIELDSSDARAKRALASVQELMCTFEPIKESTSYIKNSDTTRLNELKNSLENKSNNRPTFLSKPISSRIIATALTGILIFFTIIGSGVYVYSYFYVTNKNKLSENDLSHPNYLSLQIVHTFPSINKGMSIKETVDKYLKENNISIYNWYSAKENKSSNYIVVLTFAKEGRDLSAIWTVELDKKICIATNDLAKQFSGN
ncbi:MAG: tetratricopeptide repeat protein [Acidobacteria bacterium]|nr:tetratricopeptide repeat protein [Acidobacteriota bacterium]